MDSTIASLCFLCLTTRGSDVGIIEGSGATRIVVAYRWILRSCSFCISLSGLGSLTLRRTTRTPGSRSHLLPHQVQMIPWVLLAAQIRHTNMGRLDGTSCEVGRDFHRLSWREIIKIGRPHGNWATHLPEPPLWTLGYAAGKGVATAAGATQVHRYAGCQTGERGGRVGQTRQWGQRSRARERWCSPRRIEIKEPLSGATRLA